MNCRLNQSKLIEYLLNELASSEKIKLERHMETCSSCRHQFMELKGVLQELNDGSNHALEKLNEDTFIHQLNERIDAENKCKSPFVLGALKIGWTVTVILFAIVSINVIHSSHNNNSKSIVKNDHKKLQQIIYQSIKKPAGLRMDIKRPSVEMPRTNKISMSKMPSFPSKPKYKMKKTQLKFKIGT